MTRAAVIAAITKRIGTLSQGLSSVNAPIRVAAEESLRCLRSPFKSGRPGHIAAGAHPRIVSDVSLRDRARSPAAPIRAITDLTHEHARDRVVFIGFAYHATVQVSTMQSSGRSFSDRAESHSVIAP